LPYQMFSSLLFCEIVRRVGRVNGIPIFSTDEVLDVLLGKLKK